MKALILTIALACSSAYAQTTPPKGSFGFLINFWQTKTNTDVNGAAILGIMNFDGMGNVSGSATSEIGATDKQPSQAGSVKLTGSYSTNTDGTGSLTITLDQVGITITFATVITDSGQGL